MKKDSVSKDMGASSKRQTLFTLADRAHMGEIQLNGTAGRKTIHGKVAASVQVSKEKHCDGWMEMCVREHQHQYQGRISRNKNVTKPVSTLVP